MPTVTFWLGPERITKSLEVRVGANLLQVIIEAGLPIGRSCDGVGVCAKCTVKIVKGAEYVSKPTALEKSLAEREHLDGETRIACLTKVLGPVTVTTSYW